MYAAWKMSHFSMSLSSPDSSAIPCGAHLVGFSFLCFSQWTLLGPPLFLSGKEHTWSCSEQWCLSLKKPRGNVLGIAFILLKTGPSFSFVFSTTTHSCLHNSIPTPLQMDFPPLFFLNRFLPYSFVGSICTVVICLLFLSEEMEQKC